MIAWKFLAIGRVGPFTGFAWPVGAWVAAPEGAPDDRWIHACRASDLPYWVPGWPGAELWRVQLEGPVLPARWQVTSARARLLEPVAAWTPAFVQELWRDCAARARELAAGAPGADLDALADYVATIEGVRGNAAVGLFALEQLARELGGDRAGDAERFRQARWLAERLGIHPDPGG